MKKAAKGGRALKLFFVILVAVVLTAGAAWRLGYFEAEDPSANLLTSAVSKGNIEETVLATGILKPRKLIAVGAQVSGRITKVNVALGDEVKEGDLIAEIDSVTQENDLKTAKASLATVKAQLEEKQADLLLAKQTLERQTKLSTQNAVAVADLQSAQADVKIAEAQIGALEAQISEAQVAVETAQANLDYTKITAPIAGTVLAIVNQEGQTVNAAQSAPTIVVLGDLTVMTVRAEISEADVVQVEPSQDVRFSIIGEPDKSYEAKLESIEPAPESITSDSSISSSSSTSSTDSSSDAIYYNGIFHVPNEEGKLRTYMTAEVVVVLGSKDNVLLVPTSALKKSLGENKYQVQVVGADGRQQSREVTTGLNDKINAEVVSGLSEGDRVVIGEKQEGSSESEGRRGPPMGL